MPIYVLLLVTFGLHTSQLILVPHIPLKFDQRAWRGAAEQLVERGLSKWDYNERAPGYIFFLATNFWVSGETDPTFARVTQSLVGTTTTALVYACTLLLFKPLPRRRRRAVGLLAALLMATNLDYLFFTQLLWSETFFIFLVMLGVCCLLRGYRLGNQLRWFVASGIVLGMATLTRELVLVFVAFLVPLWLWLTARPRLGVGIPRAAVYVAGVLLVILPYAYRNYVQGRPLQLISWQSARIFWRDNYRVLKPTAQERAFAAQAGAALDIPQRPGKALLNGTLYVQALKLIAAQPLKWVLSKVPGAAGIWTVLGSNMLLYARKLGMVSRQARQWDDVLRGLWFLTLNLAIIGLMMPGDPRLKLLWAFYLLASVLVFFATHYMTRFRLGYEALFFPYAAFAVVELAAALRARAALVNIDVRRGLATAFVLILLNWNVLSSFFPL